MEQGDFIGKVQDKGQQELLEAWYDEYYRNTFGVGFREAAGVPPNLAHAFMQWSVTSIHDKVCVQWEYCKKKRSMGQPAQLATALADFLAPLAGFTTNGALSVAFLLVQYGFDSICDCDGDAPVKPSS
ncbi:MAG TPA: hypothetical protein VLV54_20300 [Thermoanaerobaculia bacterium]|nr:hypothetical protein [Thermoanaerobaculia bacterium]